MEWAGGGSSSSSRKLARDLNAAEVEAVEMVFAVTQTVALQACAVTAAAAQPVGSSLRTLVVVVVMHLAAVAVAAEGVYTVVAVAVVVAG